MLFELSLAHAKKKKEEFAGDISTGGLVQSRPRAPSRRVSHTLSESSSTHKKKMPNTVLNLNRKTQAETLELEKLKGYSIYTRFKTKT